ncbi:MAG: dTDP-glucose 4,6-dehydratase [candidate division WOR-3 bacterium]
MRLLVTGGCGFIGSNFIRYILGRHPDYEVVNLDALTYAGNQANLADLEGNSRYRLIIGRIEEPATAVAALKGCSAVVHFAAESHVDRSIAAAAPFIITNVVGTQVLLDAARQTDVGRFVHVSTDEVYGSLGETGLFTENTPLAPRSPYAASKAAADMLCHAYFETYRFPVCVVRPSNNYGPFQFPEKFIPLMITNILEGKKIPVYGRGLNVRDWLHVEDCCRAIELVLKEGRPGEAYNIGGENQRPNIEVARLVLKLLGKPEELIEFVPDRPGHDFRYALDNKKIRSELNWQPVIPFEEGLARTVRWFIDHPDWWQPLKARLVRESRGFWTG